MIKNNQQMLNRLHVFLDVLVIVASYALAWGCLVIGNMLFAPGRGVLPPEYYFSALIAIIPLYLLLYASFRLYEPKRRQSRRVEFSNILKANLIGLMILTMTFFLFRGRNPYFQEFSSRMILYFFAINVFAGTMERSAIRVLLRTMRKKGYNQKHVLLIGFSRTAEGFIDRAVANPEWGYHIWGILDDTMEEGYTYRKVPVIGTIAKLESILELNTLDEIAITLAIGEYAKLEQIVSACEKSGVHTMFLPDYNNVIPTRPYTEDLQGLPVINIRHVPLNSTFNRAIKRAMDIVGSLAGILLFSPVMLAAAVIIKLTSPGPLIFKQERVGLHNRPFQMYKFRSMEVQKPSEEKDKWTTPHDPRVTPFGKFIRKVSIDEMPQFFNVLKGDMSLVGPRPERPFFVERFKEEIPRYMIKHQVRPGMTGWAQINGYRGDTSITKRIEHDLYYIENWTLGLDIKILFLTIFKGFINKNAY